MRETVTDCHFSLTEAAHYLGRSPRWLQYKLTGHHPPPAFKTGKNWLFKKSELDRWLEQFRAVSNIDAIIDEVVAEVTRASGK